LSRPKKNSVWDKLKSKTEVVRTIWKSFIGTTIEKEESEARRRLVGRVIKESCTVWTGPNVKARG